MLLLIDTSSTFCSIALMQYNKTYGVSRNIPRQHNKYLISMLDDLLAANQLRREDISCIAYGVGPGSFVGIRLSAAFCQGLSIALNVPLKGFSSMQAMAYQFIHKSNIIHVILDAKMNEVYYGCYDFSSLESKELLTMQNKLELPHNAFIISDIQTISANEKISDFDLCTFIRLVIKHEKLLITDPSPIYLQGVKNWKKKDHNI